MKQQHTRVFSLAALSSALISLLSATTVNAHGYLDSPKARQAICEDQQGFYWPADGSAIPNKACRAAFLESSHIPFVQEHEFSANTVNYHDISAVQQSVPDGLLCSGGDSAKAGMDIPSSHWQRTEVVPNSDGEIKVRFLATTPHNPSFWQFYLTNPGFDGATQTLSWSDLTLVQEYGTLDFVKGENGARYYEMQVKIPSNRSGDAILYTRWQRDDAAGEGFYNCSDITINQDGSEPDTSTWQAVAYFVQQGQTPAVGDTVWARLFDETGQEIINQHFDVTAQNSPTWASDLAQALNLDYGHLVRIGLADQNGSIAFQTNDVLVNQVYTQNSDYSFALSIQSPAQNTPPQVMQPDNIRLDEQQSTQVHVHAFDDEQSALTYRWDIPDALDGVTDGPNATFTAPSVESDTDYTVGLSVSDGALTSSVSFVVSVLNTDETDTGGDPDSNYPQWDANTVYDTGTMVTFEGNTYQAKWWNEGKQPDTSNAWQKINTEDGVNTWHTGSVYQENDIVLYNDQQYRAKWWTQGDIPGQSDAWEAL